MSVMMLTGIQHHAQPKGLPHLSQPTLGKASWLTVSNQSNKTPPIPDYGWLLYHNKVSQSLTVGYELLVEIGVGVTDV